MRNHSDTRSSAYGRIVAIPAMRSVVMTRGTFLVAVGVTAWVLGTAPAWAQRERGGAETTGSSVDRGSSSSGGSSGGSTSSGGSSSGSSSPSSSGGSGGGGYSTPSASPSGSSSREYVSAPVRPNREDRETAQGRTPSNGGGRRPSADGGGDRGGSRAVPRGSDTSSGSSGSSRTASASNGDDAPSRRAVPAYSRPRDGRPVTGTAVDRPEGYYGGGASNTVFYYPTSLYGRSRYYSPGYGFGLGFYDLGWYDP